MVEWPVSSGGEPFNKTGTSARANLGGPPGHNEGRGLLVPFSSGGESMKTKVDDRLEFALVMGREYPTITVAILNRLMMLSRHHARLQERACNFQVPENHDKRTEDRIRDLVDQLPGCKALFSGDPRGCTVKLQVPSGRTNDWGAEGICVPQ